MMSLLSCRDNAFRASLALDGRLSPGGRIVLLLHQMMCAGCRAYARQIRGLASLLRRRQLRDESVHEASGTLSVDARQRITEALRDQGRPAMPDPSDDPETRS